MDFQQAVESYLTYAHSIKEYSPATLYSYRRVLMRFGGWGKLNHTSEISLKLVEDYIAENYFSRDSRFNVILTIRSFIRYLQRLNIAPFDHNLIDVPRRIRKPRHPLTVDEVQAVLGNLQRERDRLMFLIMYTSGIRVAELVNIKFEDIKGTKIQVTGKGSYTRTIRFDPHVAQRLQIYLAFENITSGYVFRAASGGPIGTYVVRYAVRRAADKAGIKKRVYPHLIRHTFGSLYTENGGDVRSLQIILGHKQIQTTQIYMQMNDPWVKEQYAKFKPQVVLHDPRSYQRLKDALENSDSEDI